jgi:oxygen-dependent protoporphyrinogen oxidase
LSDPSNSIAPLRLAVVGGGITGLTAAYRLSKLLPDAEIELFEGSDRLGGVLWTLRQEDLLVERGADSFLQKLPWAIDLCKELGLENQILPTNKVNRRALVVRNGQLYPVPEGFVVMRPNRLGPVLRSPLLSLRGKLRLLRERWVPAAQGLEKQNHDESVASFARRRLGQETFQQLVQPLLAGIYTADPEKLSLAATMPTVIEDERQYGSLRKAAKANRTNSEKQASGARYASFVSLQGGLQQLIETLEKQLPPEQVHLNCPIANIKQATDKRWTINFKDGKPSQTFEGVIVALPAPRAAKVVANIDNKLGELLQKIPYASSAVVSMTFSRDQITKPLDGFGIVVPTVEGMNIVAASFSSIKFPQRAPEGQILVRVFLGGALRPELVDLPDEQLQKLASTELSKLIGIQGQPTILDVVRWREKMPQYHVGHVQLVEAIESQGEQHQGLELAGNAYHGVGIPQCVRSGN